MRSSCGAATNSGSTASRGPFWKSSGCFEIHTMSACFVTAQNGFVDVLRIPVDRRLAPQPRPGRVRIAVPRVGVVRDEVEAIETRLVHGAPPTAVAHDTPVAHGGAFTCRVQRRVRSSARFPIVSSRANALREPRTDRSMASPACFCTCAPRAARDSRDCRSAMPAAPDWRRGGRLRLNGRGVARCVGKLRLGIPSRRRGQRVVRRVAGLCRRGARVAPLGRVARPRLHALRDDRLAKWCAVATGSRRTSTTGSMSTSHRSSIWLIALPMALANTTASFAQHAPNLVALVLSVFFLRRLGARLFGRADAGWLAAGLYVSTLLPFALLRDKRIDPLFSAFLLGAFDLLPRGAHGARAIAREARQLARRRVAARRRDTDQGPPRVRLLRRGCARPRRVDRTVARARHARRPRRDRALARTRRVLAARDAPRRRLAGMESATLGARLRHALRRAAALHCEPAAAPRTVDAVPARARAGAATVVARRGRRGAALPGELVRRRLHAPPRHQRQTLALSATRRPGCVAAVSWRSGSRRRTASPAVLAPRVREAARRGARGRARTRRARRDRRAVRADLGARSAKRMAWARARRCARGDRRAGRSPPVAHGRQRDRRSRARRRGGARGRSQHRPAPQRGLSRERRSCRRPRRAGAGRGRHAHLAAAPPRRRAQCDPAGDAAPLRIRRQQRGCAALRAGESRQRSSSPGQRRSRRCVRKQASRWANPRRCGLPARRSSSRACARSRSHPLPSRRARRRPNGPRRLRDVARGRDGARAVLHRSSCSAAARSQSGCSARSRSARPSWRSHRRPSADPV